VGGNSILTEQQNCARACFREVGVGEGGRGTQRGAGQIHRCEVPSNGADWQIIQPAPQEGEEEPRVEPQEAGSVSGEFSSSGMSLIWEAHKLR